MAKPARDGARRPADDELDRDGKEEGRIRQSLSDESLIPRSPWKVTLLCLTGLFAWAGMLWLGIDTAWQESALEDVVSLQSGRIAKFFSTVTLLSASQLSTLILWYRSKSRKDFAGRYRLWAWASIYWSALCMGAATGFHLPLAQMLYDYWQVECWRPETVYWLAPAAAGFAAIYALLRRELRQSTAGSLLWNLCGLAGVATLLLHVGLDLSITPEMRLVVDIGTATFWHLSAAIVLLVHARFVVHVNNEAAPRKAKTPNRLVAGYLGLIRRILMLVRWPGLPRLRFPRLRLPGIRFNGWKRAVQPTVQVQSPAVAAPKATPVRKKKTDEASSTRATPAADAMASETMKASPSTATGARPAPQKVAPVAPPRQVRVDPPAVASPAPKTDPLEFQAPAATHQSGNEPSLDTDELDWDDDEAGNAALSRKERRKLRKLRRG